MYNDIFIGDFMKVYFDLDGVIADFEYGYKLLFPYADITNKKRSFMKMNSF